MINRISRTRDITSSDRNNKITTEIYYSKGGMNYFTNNNEKRGYYFGIMPEEYKDGWKTCTAFSGVKTCILEVNRQSKSAYEKAKAMFDNYENKYLKTFCEQKGYTLVDINNYVERERD